MTDTPRSRRGPIRYEIRLQGHLDQHWSNWFTGLTLSQNQDGTTSLRGTLEDQAELHGLLTKVRDLGATLLSVISIASPAPAPETENDAHRGNRTTAEPSGAEEPTEPTSPLRADDALPGDAPRTPPGETP
jgi:hypothetical protein